MPRKPATQEQRQEARLRIQKAAARLYLDQGLGGISARAIASGAGVSVGTLYSYFENLPTLMQSLWTEPLEQVNRRLEAVAAKTKDPVERIRSLAKAYLDIARKNPDLYRGAFLFVRPDTLPKPKQVDLENYAFPRLLIAAITEAQALGDVRPGDTRQMAQIFWASLHGCIALPSNFDRLNFDDPMLLAEEAVEQHLEAIVRKKPCL